MFNMSDLFIKWIGLKSRYPSKIKYMKLSKFVVSFEINAYAIHSSGVASLAFENLYLFYLFLCLFSIFGSGYQRDGRPGRRGFEIWSKKWCLVGKGQDRSDYVAGDRGKQRGGESRVEMDKEVGEGGEVAKSGIKAVRSR